VFINDGLYGILIIQFPSEKFGNFSYLISTFLSLYKKYLKFIKML